ncbi:MAG: hypothetical protein IKS83_07360 [Victivallales bacterium]|nr:hypothetical protein [Victivallales bacterium]
MMQTRRILSFHYPLTRDQMGTPLGNGYLGALVWGEGRILHVSFGCGALWDHRGGMHWSERQNYRDIFQALKDRDQERIARIFATDDGDTRWDALVPSLIPVGRITLELPEGWRIGQNCLDLSTGVLTVKGSAANQAMQCQLAMERRGETMLSGVPEGACVRVETGYRLTEDCPPTWCRSPMSRRGFQPPSGCPQGFVQSMPNPADGAYGLWFQRSGDKLLMRFAHEPSAEKTRETLEASADLNANWEAITQENAAHWTSFWRDVPMAKFPAEDLQEYYEYGLFRFQSMCAPKWNVPAGLQGPWIDDNWCPPWSSDYHFNINIQMCYWPAYRANRFANLKPLFDMLMRWRPVLRENARFYVGVEDGYMLPHAVDDRCVCMGGFWPGTTDHASACWMAQMMFDYYDYTGDEAFLRDYLYEFMVGLMKVYVALMEENPDGTLTLPLTTSPEYREGALDAWGADSSFQLSSVHRLNRNLLRAAKMLGKEPDPMWLRIAEKLPQVTLVGKKGEEEIGLWKDTELEFSHRHHSHLACISPFGTITPNDPQWKDAVERARIRWIRKGTGEWTGWSYPWASMLHTHFNSPNMAQFTFRAWKDAFFNWGGSFDYLPGYKGFGEEEITGREVMQMDSGMGMVNALQEMMLCPDGDGQLLLFGGIAPRQDAAIEEFPAPGGFKVTAECHDGQTSRVTVKATRPGTVRIRLRDGRILEHAFSVAGGSATLL